MARQSTGHVQVLSREEQEKVMDFFVFLKKMKRDDCWERLYGVYEILHNHGYRVRDELVECMNSRLDLIVDGGFKEAEYNIKKRQIENSLQERRPEPALEPLERLAKEAKERQCVLSSIRIQKYFNECSGLLPDMIRKYAP